MPARRREAEDLRERTNPHAGEDGLFAGRNRDHKAAIDAAAAEGIDVGPFGADIMFHKKASMRLS